MADVKKTVEIALNIVGADTKSTTKVITAFESIIKIVDKSTTSLNNFQTALNSIKIPSSFETIVTSLKQINGIKAPNLDNIATGFRRLGNMKNPPDLQPFADQLKKLHAVGSLPNLGQVGTGLEKIIKTPLSSLAMKVGTLETQLSRLKGIGTLPNLKQIASGVELLIKTPLSGLALKIGTLERQLTRLAGIGTLPNLGQIGIGLKNIMATPLSGFSAKITTLETGLKRLAKINLDAVATTLQNINKVNLGKAGYQLKKIEKGIQDLGNVAEKSGIKVRTFADKIRTVATFRAISTVIQNLNNAFFAGLDAIISYDQALKDLQAITGATSLEVAQMGATIIEVASTTKFSAAEVAAGMRTIGQAGFSASEAVQTMQAVSDLATGTLSSMGSTVDLVTTAMRVFQVDASQSTQIVDTFANAVNKSKLTVDKLRTAMNYVGPIAKASGVNFKELSAAMGTLANSGLRASTIGTGLRRIFAELVSPSKKLAEAARNAGVALNELDPTSNGLADVLDNLKLVLADSGTAFDIFGKRGAAASLALTNNDNGFRGMLEKVSESGTAARMAAIQMEGLGVSFKNLKDRLGVLAIAIGDGGLTTAMRAFVIVAKNIIVVFTTIANSTFGGFVVASSLVVAAIYSIITAFTLLATKVKVLKDIQIAFLLVRAGAVSAAQGVAILAKAFAPYLAVIAVMAGLAFAIDTVRGHIKENSEEAAKAADEYGTLTNVITNYKQSLIGLDVGSQELKNANLSLRDSLLKTKNEFVELSNEAYGAIASIDAIDGTVTDSGAAIDEYAEKLDALQYEKLVQSSQLANESLKDQTGWLSQLGNKFADLGHAITLSGKDLATYREKQRQVNEYATLLSEGFENSGQSFKDLGNVIKEWDHTTLTSQQKEIIQGYEFINEQSSKYIEYLIKTNKVGLDDTVENFKTLAKDAGISGVALTAVIEKLTIMKKASEEGFSNRIEKWVSDTEKADGSLGNYIDTYLKLEGAATDAEKREAQAIQASQANYIEQLNQAKELKAQQIANGVSKTEAAKTYYATERRLLQESEETGKRASQSRLIQNAKMLSDLSAKHDDNLESIALKYKNNADLIYKYQSEAILKFQAKEKRLLEGQSIDYSMIVENYKTSLGERTVTHAKHLDEIAALESKGILTTEQANARKLISTVAFRAREVSLAQVAKELIDQIEAPEEYKKANAAELKAKKALYTALTKARYDFNTDITQATQALDKLGDKSVTEDDKYNRKVQSNKEKHFTKLETLNKSHAEKVTSIKEASAEKIKAIDQEIVDNKKSLNSELLGLTASTEEKIRQVMKKGMTDVQKDASDQAAAQKYLADGQRILRAAKASGDKDELARGVDKIKQAESLASGLNDQSTAVSILKRSLSSLKDAAQTKARLKDIELVAEKEKELADTAKKLGKEDASYASKTKAAQKSFKSIAKEENRRHTTAINNITKEIIKEKEKLREALKNLDTLDPTQNHSKQIAVIDAEISALEDKTKVIQAVNTATADFVKTNKENMRIIGSGDEFAGTSIWGKWEDDARSFSNVVTKTGDDLENTFSQLDETGLESMFYELKNQVQGADGELADLTKTLDDVETKANDLSDVEIDPEVDKKDKVEALKAEIEDLVRTDKVVDIVLKFTGLDKLEDLLDDLKKLKDKKITITTKYVTTGQTSNYSGYAEGGRLPGFGGGDRNPILAEDGEWIINKYAVRKFGDSFMNSINNMSLPKFANGGRVSSPSGPTKTGSLLNGLSNFGTISLDTGTAKIPAIVQQDVVGQLNTHLNNLKRFAT